MPEDYWLSTHLSLLLSVQDPENESAWSEFVGKYRDPIVQYCCQRFHVDINVAEEIAQDVLLKLLKEMQRFKYRPDQSFRGWLRTVTANSVRTLFPARKQKAGQGKRSNSNPGTYPKRCFRR